MIRGNYITTNFQSNYQNLNFLDSYYKVIAYHNFLKKTQIRLFNFTKIRTSLCAHERRLSFCLQKRIHNVKGTCDSESTCLYLAVAIALIC